MTGPYNALLGSWWLVGLLFFESLLKEASKLYWNVRNFTTKTTEFQSRFPKIFESLRMRVEKENESSHNIIESQDREWDERFPRDSWYRDKSLAYVCHNTHSTFRNTTSEWKLDWNGERQKSAIQKEDFIYLLTFTIWYSLPWLCGCTFKMTSSCIIYAWAVIWQLSFYSFSSSFLVFHKDFAASGAQGP